MRPLALALAALLALGSSAALADHDERRGRPGRPSGTPVVVDREEMAARMERLEELLEEAYERKDRGNGRGKLRRAMEELERMQRALADAPDLRVVNPQPQPVPRPQPVPQPVPWPVPAPAPMPAPAPAVWPIQDNVLRSLGAAMAREAFPRDKLRILRDASVNHYFLVAQVKPLLEQFSFSHDRLEAARMLWPRVLDRNNGFQLYESFPFASDKQKLGEILGG